MSPKIPKIPISWYNFRGTITEVPSQTSDKNAPRKCNSFSFKFNFLTIKNNRAQKRMKSTSESEACDVNVTNIKWILDGTNLHDTRMRHLS